MTPVAILLIIGAAVVGPIEAQEIGSIHSTDKSESERIAFCRTTNKTQAAIDACIKIRFEIKRESLPELCARAMKEIGVADPLIAGAHGGWYGELDDHTRVRCIPAPEGLRR